MTGIGLFANDNYLTSVADVIVNGVENYHNTQRKSLRRLFKC